MVVNPIFWMSKVQLWPYVILKFLLLIAVILLNNTNFTVAVFSEIGHHGTMSNFYFFANVQPQIVHSASISFLFGVFTLLWEMREFFSSHRKRCPSFSCGRWRVSAAECLSWEWRVCMNGFAGLPKTLLTLKSETLFESPAKAKVYLSKW